MSSENEDLPLVLKKIIEKYGDNPPAEKSQILVVEPSTLQDRMQIFSFFLYVWTEIFRILCGDENDFVDYGRVEPAQFLRVKGYCRCFGFDFDLDLEKDDIQLEANGILIKGREEGKSLLEKTTMYMRVPNNIVFRLKFHFI